MDKATQPKELFQKCRKWDFEEDNKMRYFTNCKTAEELRKEFHRLAKELHPDNGGNAEDFKTMKAEFEKAWETIGNTYKNAEGETYQKKEQTYPQDKT